MRSNTTSPRDPGPSLEAHQPRWPLSIAHCFWQVIPYIASGFRKDKIWLRRTKRNKRQYQVVLCIDDSESMRAYGAGALACEALALICGALSRLEVGELAVLSFAERVSLLHPFDAPFTAEAGARMLSNFTFAQKHTQMEALLRDVAGMEDEIAKWSTEERRQNKLIAVLSAQRRWPHDCCVAPLHT